jgi:hypothetical protein
MADRYGDDIKAFIPYCCTVLWKNSLNLLCVREILLPVILIIQKKFETVEDFEYLMKDSKVPFHPALGNHDVSTEPFWENG